MNTKRLYLLISSALVLWAIPHAHASNKPTIDSLVAALKLQEARCGPSLKVRYTTDSFGPATAGRLHYETLYIRTPNALFKNQKSGEWKSETPGDYRWT